MSPAGHAPYGYGWLPRANRLGSPVAAPTNRRRGRDEIRAPSTNRACAWPPDKMAAVTSGLDTVGEREREKEGPRAVHAGSERQDGSILIEVRIAYA
eukprot:g14968.t1